MSPAAEGAAAARADDRRRQKPSTLDEWARTARDIEAEADALNQSIAQAFPTVGDEFAGMIYREISNAAVAMGKARRLLEGAQALARAGKAGAR